MRPIDDTHSPDRLSWVSSANDAETEFPIQNLPYCCFRSDDESEPRIGVGIGDQVLNLHRCAESGLYDADLTGAIKQSSLNEVMALPLEKRQRLRHRTSELLSKPCTEIQSNSELGGRLLQSQDSVTYLLPARVRDYTDFYSSVFHATNVGSMFRPDNALLPNYKYVPIGYHGRASSLVISGTPVHRPRGQLSPAQEGSAPTFEPCKLLDYELEVGFFVGPGNQLGSPIPIESAEDHIFGLCLVNDWSARDIQKWEYQPLGPFLAKSFATTLSPWVVTLEALAPFRCPAFERPPGDPAPLEHLASQAGQTHGGVDLQLEVFLRSEQMRAQRVAPIRLSRGNFHDMYWTIGQMLTHHSSNGCNLQPGDLMASGTVSNRDRQSRGCLLELTWDGELDRPVPGTQRTAIELPTGEQRKFLADGDEVIFRGFCENQNYRRIGFGECTGRIQPA